MAGETEKIPPDTRFWAKVDTSGDCWVWTAATNRAGYGIFHPGNDGPMLAHRYAKGASIITGIPDGMFVLHRCDNPPCVRPGHLFFGGHADNMADKKAKGRAKGGRADQTHCINGHELTSDNVRIKKKTEKYGGYTERVCIPCARDCDRERKRRKRDQQKASI